MIPSVSGTIQRVRELEIRYKPHRLALPVSAGRVSTAAEAARLVATILADSPVEKVITLHFSTKLALIGLHVVSMGTLDSSLVHPREVFRAAFLTNASGIIVAHNHPSGDVSPSADDHALALRLRQAGEILGVDLLDALIVTDPGEGLRYYSFKEQGVL